MSLDYHFSVEQEVGSSTYSFFGFNGKLDVHQIKFKQAPWQISLLKLSINI